MPTDSIKQIEETSEYLEYEAMLEFYAKYYDV